MEKKTLINNSLERKLGACLYEEFYIHIYIYITSTNGKVLVSRRISSFRWNLNSLRALSLGGRNSTAKKILDSDKKQLSLIGIAARIRNNSGLILSRYLVII